MLGLVLFAFLAVSSDAKTVIVAPGAPAIELDLGAIQAAMVAGGHQVRAIGCGGSPVRCVVELSDPSSATAATLAPFFSAEQTMSQKREASLTELTAIEAKLDDGTATAADLRRAVKILLKLSGWARRP